MQDTVKTAGETAKPTNPFEEEIRALNAERDLKVAEINREITKAQDLNAGLRQLIRDNQTRLQELHERKDHIRMYYKRRVAAVYDRSQDWYFDPMRNSICRRLGAFFELHGDVRELWKQEQDAINELIRNREEAAGQEGGAA